MLGRKQQMGWSREHPELSKIVWPQVVEWARNEQYDEVYSLFWITDLQNAKSPEDVHRAIKLAKVYASQ